MSVCITGIDLPLGAVLVDALRERGYAVQGVPLNQFSMPREAVVRHMKSMPPCRYIIHCAELSDQGLAEQHPDLAYQFNVGTAAATADVAAHWSAAVLNLSSFLIFDGLKKNPYIAANSGRPLSVYGRTKLQAEEYLQDRVRKLINLRLGWLLSPAEDSWLHQVCRQLADGVTVPGMEDVMVAPVAADDVSRVVVALLQQLDCEIDVWGNYHYAGAEAVTHQALLQAIAHHWLGREKEEQAVSAVSRQSLAADLEGNHWPWPENGVLGCIKLRNTFGIKQLPWRRYLPGMIEDIRQQQDGKSPDDNSSTTQSTVAP